MPVMISGILENPTERNLNTIEQTWIFEKNRHVGPQGHTWNDFEIRDQGGEKPYPGYNSSIFINFGEQKFTPSTTPQTKFQASKYITGQMGPKS